jgi:hypothetical protein
LTFGLLRLSNDQIEEFSLFLGQLPPELRERFAGYIPAPKRVNLPQPKSGILSEADKRQAI